MKRILILLPILFSLNSCSTIRLIHLLKQGDVNKKDFYQETPIYYDRQAIYTDVSIQGKKYRFILDTGAPNIIASDLADSLNLEAKCTAKSIDSQGNESKMEFSELEEIKIAELAFCKQGTAIVDFKSHDQLSCFDFDGILGANLMKNAVWQIDLENNVLLVANSIDKFKIPDDVPKTSFRTEISGTPTVSIQVSTMIIDNVTLDYGSNGGIEIGLAGLIDTLQKQNLEYTRTFGYSSLGLYGGKNDTMYTYTVSDISIENFSVGRQKINVNNTGVSILGTDFLKNYLVTIDWPDKIVYFEKVAKDSIIDSATFGFNVIMDGEKLVVAQLSENSKAHKSGLSLNDQILKVNEKDYSQLSKSDYCEIVRGGLVDEKVNKIDLTYKNKTGIFNLRLKREIFY